jgi:hypothetical protein
MTITIFRHKGHWDSQTHQNRALRFIESYTLAVESDLSLTYPSTKYYSPTCPFYDTTNVIYAGADAIKAWMLHLFSPFDKVHLEGMSFMVVDESENGKAAFTVNAEFMATYWLKGDERPIEAPRLFVFTIEDGETEDGEDGLQFSEVHLYWDTALVANEAKRRAVLRKGET